MGSRSIPSLIACDAVDARCEQALKLLLAVVPAMQMTREQTCRTPHTSLYINNNTLTQFPLNADCHHTININRNNITSLKHAHGFNCDKLKIANNKIRNLTADFGYGFPNVTDLYAIRNPIDHLDGEVLKGLRKIDLSYTLLDDFPWEDAPTGLRVSLRNVTLECGCAMKRARDRGVRIHVAPTCTSGKPWEETLDELQCREREHGKILKTVLKSKMWQRTCNQRV